MFVIDCTFLVWVDGGHYDVIVLQSPGFVLLTTEGDWGENERLIDWLSSVLRPLQHSIGYMGDGFYRSKDPTNSIKLLKEKAVKENNTKKT